MCVTLPLKCYLGLVGEAFMDSGLTSVRVCLVTHLARSLIDWSGRDQLEGEVAQLRVEVHRAKELVSSFNTVLEACEKSNGWLRFTNRSLGFLLLGVVIVIAAIGWLVVFRQGFSFRAEVPVEIPSLPAVTPSKPAVPPAQSTLRTGPGRPSTHPRGRELVQ